MVDPNLVVGIGVAAGTIALAAATFSMARQGSLQLKELRRQNLLSSSKHEPILKVTDFKFIDNKLRAVVTNIGEGRATWLGMSMDFTPSETAISGDSESSKVLEISEIIDYIKKKKQLYSRNEIKIDATFEFEGKAVYPTELISFPFEQGLMILDHKETGVLSVEALFGMGSKIKLGNKERVMTSKAFTFDELKEFLKKNGVYLIAVDVGVIGKDMMENPTPVTRLATFFVNFAKHKTLEEAYSAAVSNDQKPYFLPLTDGEIRFLDGDMYRNMRSQSKSDT